MKELFGKALEVVVLGFMAVAAVLVEVLQMAVVVVELPNQLLVLLVLELLITQETEVSL